jgi:hypothetical protein
MTGDNSTCIPDVEMRHLLDWLDTDGGPLQRLAPGTPALDAEPVRETVPVSVSGSVSDAPDAGYPLAM